MFLFLESGHKVRDRVLKAKLVPHVSIRPVAWDLL